MALEISEMSRVVDLIDVSGKALELLNQLRKHCKTSNGGGRNKEASLMVRQLGKIDIAIAHIQETVTVRQGYYQRSQVISGHKGKELKLENSNSNMAKGKVKAKGKKAKEDGRQMADGP